MWLQSFHIEKNKIRCCDWVIEQNFRHIVQTQCLPLENAQVADSTGWCDHPHLRASNAPKQLNSTHCVWWWRRFEINSQHCNACVFKKCNISFSHKQKQWPASQKHLVSCLSGIKREIKVTSHSTTRATQNQFELNCKNVVMMCASKFGILTEFQESQANV